MDEKDAALSAELDDLVDEILDEMKKKDKDAAQTAENRPATVESGGEAVKDTAQTEDEAVKDAKQVEAKAEVVKDAKQVEAEAEVEAAKDEADIPSLTPPHDFLSVKPAKPPKKNSTMTVIAAAAVLVAVLITALTLTLRCYRVELDGQAKNVYTFLDDEDAAIAAAGVEMHDGYVSVSNNLSPITDVIKINTAFNVTLHADKTVTTKLVAAGSTRDEVLEAFGVSLGEYDTTTMNSSDRLTGDLDMTVNRVSLEYAEYDENIPCPLDDQTQPELGTETLTDEGMPGLRRVCAWQKYVDGVLVSTTEVSSETITEPTPTLKYSIQPIKGVGEPKPTEYVREFIGEATAYTGIGGITATGKRTQWGYVAVDPTVIPLGTRMYIESVDGSIVYGYCEAQDTGGAVKGDIIDLFMYTYDDCINFGRRAVRVYILAD